MNLSPLIAAMALALVYVLGSWLHRRAEGLGHRRWLSLAAGVSTAYVFVDVLPELSLRNRVIVELEGAHPLFGEQRIYVVALVAFVLLYGLSHLALTRRPIEASQDGGVVGLLHVAGFALYSWLIGYLLVERSAKGALSLALYSVAMGLHFLIIDHSLREQRGPMYERLGRWIMAASVPAGCLMGWWLPLSEPVLARLFAFLAGGMIITSAQAELPGEREGRFWPFCLGAIAYAVLLLAA